MPDPIRYLSLFAGVGGFDLGADAAGWECVGQVEWDQHCQKVLTRHWPHVPKYLDVRDVIANPALLGDRGGDAPGTLLNAADVIVGGFP